MSGETVRSLTIAWEYPFDVCSFGNPGVMSTTTTVIVTRNNCRVLLRVLTHVATPAIVVDNGSTDATVERVRRTFPEVRVIALDSDVGAMAYNIGARAAHTRYVAFSDDRSWWEAGAVESAAASLDEHPSIGLVGVSSRTDRAEQPDQLAAALGQSALSGSGRLPGVPSLGFVDCLCLVRRQPFLDQGGFDSLAGFGGIEQRLALDMANAGWAVRFRTDLVVRRGKRPTCAGAIRIRDDIVTAIMRRPLRVAAHRAIDYLASTPFGWVGVVRAAFRVPRALLVRRPVSARIEIRARLAEPVGRRSLKAIR